MSSSFGLGGSTAAGVVRDVRAWIASATVVGTDFAERSIHHHPKWSAAITHTHMWALWALAAQLIYMVGRRLFQGGFIHIEYGRRQDPAVVRSDPQDDRPNRRVPDNRQGGRTQPARQGQRNPSGRPMATNGSGRQD
jgi:hypothetical protein